MKRPLILLSIFIIVGKLYGQDKTFQLGVGFEPNYEVSNIDYFNDELGLFPLTEKIPHIQFTTDYSLNNEIGPGKITAGHLIGIAQYAWELDESIKFYFLNIGARGGYALNPIVSERIQPYGGVELLYNYLIITDNTTGVLTQGNQGSIDFSFYLGSRFYLLDGFGVYAELDPLYTIFKAGLFFN